jgi:hypothetical protein
MYFQVFVGWKHDSIPLVHYPVYEDCMGSVEQDDLRKYAALRECFARRIESTLD